MAGLCSFSGHVCIYHVLLLLMVCLQVNNACGVLKVTGVGASFVKFGGVGRLCFGFNSGSYGFWGRCMPRRRLCEFSPLSRSVAIGLLPIL